MADSVIHIKKNLLEKLEEKLFLIFGPNLAVLKNHSLMVGAAGIGCQGLSPGWPYAKQLPYLLYFLALYLCTSYSGFISSDKTRDYFEKILIEILLFFCGALELHLTVLEFCSWHSVRGCSHWYSGTMHF